MSVYGTPGSLCPHITIGLDQIFGSNNAALSGIGSANRNQIGTIMALTSAVNNTGSFINEEYNKNGHIAEVRGWYTQRAAPGDISPDAPTDICECANPYQRYELNFDLTYNASYCIEMTAEDFRYFCDGPSGSIEVARMKSVMDALNAMHLKMNEDAVTHILANKGVIATQATNVGAFDPIVSGAANVLGTDGWSGVVDEFYFAYGGSPFFFMIGAGELNTFMAAQKWACCNTTIGTDLALSDEAMFMRDPMINQVVGAGDNFLQLIPGAVIPLMGFNRNVGQFAIANPTDISGTIFDPILNTLLDVDVVYDRCRKAWVMTISKTYGFATLPIDLYKPTDPLFLTNGIGHYQA